MFRSRKSTPSFSVTIARAALESIFDDCDKYDADETGGRLLGTYRTTGSNTAVQLMGVLEAGPNAERSPVFFQQDGDHQEKLFRSIEKRHPDVEHLGNWHTHHVNGLQTLSGGDHTTYTKTVNHKNHNTDFFYALLVVRKNARGNPRYQVKHFFFRRDDKTVYEVPNSEVRVVDAPIYGAADDAAPATSTNGQANPERAEDQRFFSDFHPGFKALMSKSIGAPYWKGSIPLVDGSKATIATIEGSEKGRTVYSITAASDDPVVADLSATYRDRHFPSARHAVVEFERDANRALYRKKRG
jgi:hypothetical protein